MYARALAGALLVLVTGSAQTNRPAGTLAFGTGQYVFAVVADGTGGHAVGRGDYPAYSRDGRSLAFTLDGVWVARADGTRRTHIVPRFAEYITYTTPTWSPDGSALAYIRVDNGHETSELWVVRRDGTKLHGLAIVHAADAATWSPDGRWIAYAGDGGLSEVLAAGTGTRLLLHGEVAFPAWSPDGRSIAYEEQQGKRVAIRLLDVHSHVSRLVQRHIGSVGPLAWSPDGRWLAFTTQQADAGGAFVQVRAVRLADGAQHVVTRSFAQHLDGLTWRR
jgi:Tol biopolymer transport system component